MAPDTTRPESKQPRESTITSLQRELAEAREACRQAVDAMRDYPAYPEDADADKLEAARKRCETVLATGPSEPAQKLVKLPEGARVFVPADESGEFAVVDSGFPVSPIVGRFNEAKGPYGVDAERAWDQTELHRAQCEAIGLRAEVERQCERIASLTSAAETAEAEVARLEIVGHEGAARCERYKSEAERLRKAVEEAHAALLRGRAFGGTRSDAKHAAQSILQAALAPPTAASGEKAFTIDPQWLLKMADAEDAVGGLAIGASPLASQPPSAPAAEREGGDFKKWWEQIDECERVSYSYPDARMGWLACKAALSARLAACEERCKELEAGLRFIGSDPGLSIASRFFYDQLLAPKAEGGRDGR